MPTYEYRCTKGHAFEVFQRMSDEPVSACPECGAKAERMLSGGVGVLFRGEGFYITDYRSDDYRKKAEKDRGGSPDAPPSKSADKLATPAPAASSSKEGGKGASPKESSRGAEPSPREGGKGTAPRKSSPTSED